MTRILAEIDTGHQNLFLVAGSVDPWEIETTAKFLKTMTPLASPSKPPGGLVMPLTWPAIVQLTSMFGDDFVKGEHLQAWITDQAARRTERIFPALPDYVHIPDALIPRDYQVAGAVEIARTGKALIFDEPRTGKTITTILGLMVLAGPEQKSGLPILVVCPASVVDPWVAEFRRWAPNWRTVAWLGMDRDALAGTADVYVTSYDMARLWVHSLLDLDCRSVIVDETHFVKNPNAQRTHAVKNLTKNAEQFIGLSGTPITRSPADLVPALQCLEPKAYPAKERWVNRYCISVPGEYATEILGLYPATEPEFRLCLIGQHRRVARADVMDQLPQKVYSTRTVDLPDEWRKVYDDFEATMYAELPDGQELAVMDVLSRLTHLSSLSSAAADVQVTVEIDDHGEEKNHVHLDLKLPSWKVETMLEILEERPDEKVVVFGYSAQLIKLAGQRAAKCGHDVGYIIGRQSRRERTETVERFQHGNLNLICATTGSGGTGLTLSAAGTLVFLQRPWFVESIQAEDRAEGDMNATRGTEIIDVIARNTIDSRRRTVLRERAGQLSDLLKDPRIVAELFGGLK